MKSKPIEDNVNAWAEAVRPELQTAKRRVDEWNHRATGLLARHPGVCLLGAAALGFLVARLARRVGA